MMNTYRTIALEYGTTNQKRDFFLDTKEKDIYIYIIKMKVLFNQTKHTLQTEQNLMQYIRTTTRKFKFSGSEILLFVA